MVCELFIQFGVERDDPMIGVFRIESNKVVVR